MILACLLENFFSSRAANLIVLLVGVCTLIHYPVILYEMDISGGVDLSVLLHVFFIII